MKDSQPKALTDKGSIDLCDKLENKFKEKDDASDPEWSETFLDILKQIKDKNAK